MPAEINVHAVQDLTGGAAVFGLSAQRGMDLAVEEINQEGLIPGSELVVEYSDSAGNPQTAASQLTSAIADDSNVAFFGPVTSAAAIATAAIAQSSQAPIIYAQAGSDGVVIGDYTFRITPPMATYFPRIRDFLVAEDIKSMGVVFTSDFPTLAGIADETLPALAEELGIEITSMTGVPLSTQDFTAPIQKAIEGDPDAVALLLVGAQNPTAVKQLRQAGFDGPVVGNSGAGANSLAPAGELAAGFTWPGVFHHEQPGETSQAFVEAYTAEYGEPPLTYSAEMYDGVHWLAKAINEAGCADRASIQQGLTAVAEQGFEGALGDVTFEGNDARLDGVIVQWDGSQETLVEP